MAAFESSQVSQLQGVSQQVARERLEGQVSAQDNMLADVVSGLRRRPGAEFQTTAAIAGASRDTITGWSTDIGGQQVRLVLSTVDGTLRIFSEEWELLATMPASPYLRPSNRKSIRAAVVGDTLVIANVEQKPTTGPADPAIQNPTNRGFAFVKTGNFDREYTLSVLQKGKPDVTVKYKTPPTSEEGAAAKAIPEYIAGQLATALTTAGVPNFVMGGYIFVLTATTEVKVTTPMPTVYLGTSNFSYVQLPSDLPARLPIEGDGYVVAVGALSTPTYYRFDYERTAWLECGKYGSPGTLTNMPIQLVYKDDAWKYENDYEGRLAGDEASNPMPAFMDAITGVGSFQGRLVLLAGNRVCLSASNKPGRFFRTTVNTVVASDPIEVGASANSSAAYEYCEPFQKDLLLFSRKYQALIPGGNAALSPNNASVVITSTYEADMTTRPVPIGRTLMYAAPRSRDFYGVMEMVPSQYADSQYLSEDVTAHLPKYLAGRCRFGVSSSVANIACFASTLDYRVLYVHEYLWSGTDKVQQAWHRWTFPYDIADAFFSGADINLLFTNGESVAVATLDPRIGTLTSQADRRPFMDMYTACEVVDNICNIPQALLDFDPTITSRLSMSDTSLSLMGERVGVERREAKRLETMPSFPSGRVTVGITYRSSFSPTTPMIKDQNGVVISSNKLTLLRYMIGTANSYEYTAIVRDAVITNNSDEEQMPVLYWGTAELELGQARVNSESTAIVPCRTNANTTTLILSTDGLGEMNIISIEYVCRYSQKLRRR